VIDDVRRRVQQDQTGHRGRTGDPLYGARKLLLTACETLTPRGWHRLAAALRSGDPDGEVLAAWQLKELTRDLYRANTLPAAREILHVIYAWADTSKITELRRLARTVRRWQTEVLAFHTTGGASNGPTEAVNLSIKQIPVFVWPHPRRATVFLGSKAGRGLTRSRSRHRQAV